MGPDTVPIRMSGRLTTGPLWGPTGEVVDVVDRSAERVSVDPARTIKSFGTIQNVEAPSFLGRKLLCVLIRIPDPFEGVGFKALD